MDNFDTVLWPLWLDEYMLSDAVRSQAYENLKDDEKACIKNAIAFHYDFQQKKTILLEQKQFFSTYILKKTLKPYERVIFIVKENTAPALLIAELIPALVAEVPLALCFENAPSEALIACIELLGIENVFVLPLEKEKNIVKLIKQLNIVYTSINVVLLDYFPALEEFLSINSINFRLCYQNPIIYLKEKPSAIWHYCYPQGKFIHDLQEKTFDIAYMHERENSVSCNSLLVSKGLECLLSSHLSVEDYFIKELSITYRNEV